MKRCQFSNFSEKKKKYWKLPTKCFQELFPILILPGILPLPIQRTDFRKTLPNKKSKLYYFYAVKEKTSQHRGVDANNVFIGSTSFSIRSDSVSALSTKQLPNHSSIGSKFKNSFKIVGSEVA